jgi:parallel beta-helix repeat protein
MERPEAFSSEGKELLFPYKHAILLTVCVVVLIVTGYGIWELKVRGDYILSPIKAMHHFTFSKPVQSGLQSVPFLVNLSKPTLPVDEDHVMQADLPMQAEDQEPIEERLQQFNWEEDRSREWLPPDRKRRVLRVPDEYPTIQEALKAAAPGNQIIIDPGIYEESVLIDKTVEIGAETLGTVTLRTDSDIPVIQVRDGAIPRIYNLTIEHLKEYRADEPAALIYIKDSSPTIMNCILQFSYGSGIEITGLSRPRIENSAVKRNGGIGVHIVGEKVKAILVGNEISSNEAIGVVFAEGAGGALRDNTIRSNGWDGVGVFDLGTNPIIYNNVLSGNGRRGLAFGRGAGGLAQSNTIEENGWDGIVVTDLGTAPKINYNTIRRNNMRGILFMDGASGVANANLIENNFETGIIVSGAGTTPELNFNRSNRNGLWGYDYDQGASAVRGRGNSAHGNAAGAVRDVLQAEM